MCTSFVPRTSFTKTAGALMLLAGVGIGISACDTYAGDREASVTCPALGGPRAVTPDLRRQALACRAEQSTITRSKTHRQDVAREQSREQYEQ